MKPPESRRTFLKISAGSVALPFLLPGTLLNAAVPGPSTESTEGLTTYQLGPQIWVRWNNRPLTCYRAHRTQKYPYLYPLSGPATGLSLTDETALPYPHHRSLFFGCDKVNGDNYWQEGLERGQILSIGPKLGKTTGTSVEILDRCDWQRPGGPVVMRDQRKITVAVPNPRLRLIDWEIECQAVADVKVEKTNHSLFSMRAALEITPQGGGSLVNAEGATGEKGTHGVPSAWCTFYGSRAPGKMEGIALLDHPRNLWAPTPWFTRDYGFASPTPMDFLKAPWELAAGKTGLLRYRVILYSGTPQEAGLPALYRDWAG